MASFSRQKKKLGVGVFAHQPYESSPELINWGSGVQGTDLRERTNWYLIHTIPLLGTLCDSGK